ncbi:hypothetical protein GWK36_01990 [Caldichromatium japonicum]|uniref:DUF5610 domain-containing protein n=1 Tax=Caldichromatium japonicum TaxID=2699430 RepID=A0A6G7VAD1_9GAMM|nr:DUF5610 domain-containing protein [Caldichromatium japonicum]QIK36971.1 hypothetical protein GWK36_01990 [Caldichromatium japonicum]
MNPLTHLSPSASNLILRSQPTPKPQEQEQGQQGSSGALGQVQERALSSIGRALGMEVGQLKSLKAEDYIPERVAERITSFVAQGLESARLRGKSEDELQSLYESAFKGAKQGFQEARELLDSLQVLTGNIAKQVDETERLTFEGLERLAPRQMTESSITGVAAAQRFAQTDDFSLSLKTREGDTVQLRFGRSLEAQGNFAFLRDGLGNQAALLDVSRTEQTGFQFSVEGDLNEDELKAIQTLIQDISGLARDFFNGDVQKAFEQAQGIRFDIGQLAAMNLTMSRSERFSAAQVYEGVQRLDQPAQGEGRLRLGHFMRELRELGGRPELGFVEQPFQAINQILRGLVEQDSAFKSARPELQAQYREHLSQLLESLNAVIA